MVINMNKIMELFGGEFVSILLNKSQRYDAEDESTYDLPIVAKGYLIDQDDEYYYLSSEIKGIVIDKAIQIDSVLYIEKSDPEEEDILETLQNTDFDNLN